ncbi:hypothetical protein BDZ85DRAFT_259520 [Elsinoe ampelina]|uniref:Uncharacterized protein n=1 Tax=Elsinoe ampelina TaxID=302913 RepID=A0A6A6GH36_9PEZI|nr:hypothetical protein BDZ85DRAFT_259520 [Elsinoe ampelina]
MIGQKPSHVRQIMPCTELDLVEGSGQHSKRPHSVQRRRALIAWLSESCSELQRAAHDWIQSG